MKFSADSFYKWHCKIEQIFIVENLAYSQRNARHIAATSLYLTRCCRETADFKKSSFQAEQRISSLFLKKMIQTSGRQVRLFSTCRTLYYHIPVQETFREILIMLFPLRRCWLSVFSSHRTLLHIDWQHCKYDLLEHVLLS